MRDEIITSVTSVAMLFLIYTAPLPHLFRLYLSLPSHHTYTPCQDIILVGMLGGDYYLRDFDADGGAFAFVIAAALHKSASAGKTPPCIALVAPHRHLARMRFRGRIYISLLSMIDIYSHFDATHASVAIAYHIFSLIITLIGHFCSDFNTGSISTF